MGLAVRVRDHRRQRGGDVLVTANLRHVVAIALRYRRYGLPVLGSSSRRGTPARDGARQVDPDRGDKAARYLRGALIRALILDHAHPRAQRGRRGSAPLTRSSSGPGARLLEDHGRTTLDATRVNEAARGEVQHDDGEDRRACGRAWLEARDLSLDLPVGDDGSQTILDTLASALPLQEERLAGAEESARAKLSSSVRDAVKDLDPRERYIVEVRIMADAHDEPESRRDQGRRSA